MNDTPESQNTSQDIFAMMKRVGSWFYRYILFFNAEYLFAVMMLALAASAYLTPGDVFLRWLYSRGFTVGFWVWMLTVGAFLLIVLTSSERLRRFRAIGFIPLAIHYFYVFGLLSAPDSPLYTNGADWFAIVDRFNTLVYVVMILIWNWMRNNIQRLAEHYRVENTALATENTQLKERLKQLEVQPHESTTD